jgi:hypothetical protein
MDQFTLIQYFVPEDKDSQDRYNGFLIYKKIDDIRLSDIRENFPLPGKYYYRFKFKYVNDQVVWIDHSKEDSKLPRFDDKIIMKVSRLSWDSNTGENIVNSNNSQNLTNLTSNVFTNSNLI